MNCAYVGMSLLLFLLSYGAEQPFKAHVYYAQGNGITVGALLAGNHSPTLESIVLDIAALRTQQSHSFSRLAILESNATTLSSTLAELQNRFLQRRWFCCRNKHKPH